MKDKITVTNFVRPQSNKGITLIALVVTIIILIILAAVTINIIFGGGGLFTRAKEAGNSWTLAEQNEIEQLDGIGNKIDERTGTGYIKVGEEANRKSKI